MALVVVVLGLLTVIYYARQIRLNALVVTIYLNETADERSDEGWQRRLRENFPEFRAFEAGRPARTTSRRRLGPVGICSPS